LGFLIEFEGLARSSVAISALLVGLMPALIAVSAAIGGERIGLASWFGVAGATLGAALIAGKPGAGATALGVILCLISLLAFLAWLYAAKRAPADASPVDVSCAAIVIAAVVLAGLVTALHGPPNLHLSAQAWSGIAGQGLLSTIVATIAWQLGARRVASAATHRRDHRRRALSRPPDPGRGVWGLTHSGRQPDDRLGRTSPRPSGPDRRRCADSGLTLSHPVHSPRRPFRVSGRSVTLLKWDERDDPRIS
jgi:hypothetical protein